MHSIVIVGGGAFGREVDIWLADILKLQAEPEFRVKGFLSDDISLLDEFGMGHRMLGRLDDYSFEPTDRFVIAIGAPRVRQRVAEDILQRGGLFYTLVHPSSRVVTTAELGQGVIVCPFVCISDRVIVNDFAMLNLYASCGHDAVIGRYSVLCPYATLTGFANVGNSVLLGTHSTVAPHKTIGDYSQVSANVAVHRDVPVGSLVRGEMARSYTIYKPPETDAA